MTNGLNAETVVRENGGLLAKTVFFKNDGTRWTIWLVKGKLSNIYYINLYRNGEFFGTYIDSKTVPKRLREDVRKILDNAETLLPANN